eukprot:1424968-Amphidinium_carterae.1
MFQNDALLLGAPSATKKEWEVWPWIYKLSSSRVIMWVGLLAICCTIRSAGNSPNIVGCSHDAIMHFIAHEQHAGKSVTSH